MSRTPSPRWPVVFYSIAWLLAGCVAAGAIVLAVQSASGSGDGEQSASGSGGAEQARNQRPPDRLTRSCVVRRDTGPVTSSSLRVLQPPTLGPPSRPATPGIHTRPLAATELVGALRRGYIVVQYRPSLEAALVRRLRREFGAGDPPTVVAPDATGMRFTVAVTAWSRLLGCADLGEDTIAAAQEFRRRYAGAGPDARP